MRYSVAAIFLVLIGASDLSAQNEIERGAAALTAPRPRGFGVAGHQNRAFHNLPWYYTYSGVRRNLAPDPRYMPLLANGPHTPMPDCAKYGSPRACTESDPQVAQFLNYHEQFARDFPGKTYLVFNEPGRPEQGNQDPVKSAGSTTELPDGCAPWIPPPSFTVAVPPRRSALRGIRVAAIG